MREGIKSILKLNRYLFLGNKWLYISHGLMSLLWCFAPFILAFIVNLLMDALGAGDVRKYLIALAAYSALTYVNIYYARKSGMIEVKITSYVEKTLQMNTLRRILSEKQGSCEEVGMMVDVLENDFRVMERMLLVQMECLCNIFSVIGAFLIVLRVNVYLALLGFLPIAALGSLIGYFGDKVKEHFMSSRESNIDFSVMTAELVENHEVFRYMGNRESVIEAYRRKCVLRGANKLKKNRYLFCVNHSVLAVNNLSVLLILALAAVISEKDAITVGALTLFVNSTNNGFSFLQLFSDVVMALKMGESSMERICSLLALTWQEMPEQLSGKSKLPECGCKLSEKNLGLRFSGFRMCEEDERHDFQLEMGKIMVVSGGNSSGKSYFLNCIAGYHTFEGKIEMEGDYRVRAGYLPQNVTLFQASLRENVALFGESKNLREAFEASNLTGNVRNWDVMSEKSVGVNGKRLSEGQRQRVAIARAIENGKNILLLDDPFLFLDKENRRIIWENIRKLHKTAVIVSNDGNVIREADVHVVLENRKIREVRGGEAQRQ